MDPSDLLAAGAGFGAAKELAPIVVKQAEDFLAAALGEPEKSIGTIGGEFTRRRLRNLGPILATAWESLKEIGVSPEPIALNILVPGLEAASLQEDEELQKRWAYLLANAADPSKAGITYSSFVAILKDLCARDVKVLDMIDAAMTAKNRHADFQSWGVFGELEIQHLYLNSGMARHKTDHEVGLGAYMQDLSADSQGLGVTLDVLQKHKLIDAEPASVPRILHIESYLPPGKREGVQSNNQRRFNITRLGLAFIAACKPPKRTPQEGPP